MRKKYHLEEKYYVSWLSYFVEIKKMQTTQNSNNETDCRLVLVNTIYRCTIPGRANSHVMHIPESTKPKHLKRVSRPTSCRAGSADQELWDALA